MGSYFFSLKAALRKNVPEMLGRHIRKLNAELSDYYDEYMNGEYDMDFQDFVFCRKHKIRIKDINPKENAAIGGNDDDESDDE